MEKYKYLIKNIGILSISQFSTKLLSFFLVPLYTSVLTTEQYGTYDLFSTTVMLLIPLLTLNISDAVLRFSLDQNYGKSEVMSVGFQYSLIGIFLCLLIMVINYFLDIIPFINQYGLFFLLMFSVTIVNYLMTSFARGIDMVSDLAISSVISTIVIILLNILLLIVFKKGLYGYFLANIIGLLSQTLYLFVKTRAMKFFRVQIRDKSLKSQMVNYSTPLIANSISWWINNVADRYIITWLCGLEATGIYSVGYKIPSILNIFQTIFSQAWALSAVKIFEDNDNTHFFSTMYNIYNFCMTVICSILIITSRIIAKFLYINQFFSAWMYVPFLLIAILFGSLSGYIGGIFTATKDSKIFAFSTTTGAVVNIVLNFILVKIMGPIGAAIATTVSFWIVWQLRCNYLHRIIKLNFNFKRDYCCYLILILQTIALFIIPVDNCLFLSIEIGLLIIIIVCFRFEMVATFKKMINRE